MTDNIYVRLLKRAHELIANGRHEYVCHAIYFPSMFKPEENSALRIVGWIKDALGDKGGSVRDWLLARGYTGTPEDLRAYRLRWIEESLIPIWSEVEEPKE